MATEFIRLEPGLVREVVRATGISIKTQAIKRAVEEYLLAKKRKGLKKLAGKLHFYTQHDLQRMRHGG